MIAGAAAHVRYTKRTVGASASPRKQKKSPRPRHGSIGAPATSQLARDSSTERPTTSMGTAARLQVPNQIPGSPMSVTATRRRAGSVPCAQFTLANSWSLKMEYVRALKTTWLRLCDVPRSNCRGILGIMERVFEKFDAKDKHVRDVFYRAAFVDSMADTHGRRHSEHSIATLRDHVSFFISLLSQVINNLDRCPTEIFDHIDRIGSFHSALKQCGFQNRMWDRLGVCLIDAIVIQDTVRGFPEACRAWTLMLAALIDRLRSARTQIGAPLSLRGESRNLSRTTLLVEATNSVRKTSPGRLDEKTNAKSTLSVARSPSGRSSPVTFV
ncbi:Globin-like protein 9 [Aphelenchoides besseyi]|nr:Globin-like protein 9 [Aphelenchoides besseyi]KAI6199607.1 Globin-like protein 9 [Aphelenchoides besseyi]